MVREQKKYLWEKLDEFSSLPPDRRAEEIWNLWLKVSEDQAWKETGEYELVLIPRLVRLGEPAMEVLLRDIRNASIPGAEQAAEQLSAFGPEATYAVIDILQTGSEAAQLRALSALSSISVSKPSPEERAAILEAILPLLEGPNESKRQQAEIVLYYLDRRLWKEKEAVTRPAGGR